MPSEGKSLSLVNGNPAFITLLAQPVVCLGIVSQNHLKYKFANFSLKHVLNLMGWFMLVNLFLCWFRETLPRLFIPLVWYKWWEEKKKKMHFQASIRTAHPMFTCIFLYCGFWWMLFSFRIPFSVVTCYWSKQPIYADVYFVFWFSVRSVYVIHFV